VVCCFFVPMSLGPGGLTWANSNLVAAEGDLEKPAISLSNRLRSPSGSPSSSRSLSVRSASTSTSIALSRKAASYGPKPTVRNHAFIPTVDRASHSARAATKGRIALPAACAAQVLPLTSPCEDQ
jgi:hypothetical protein